MKKIIVFSFSAASVFFLFTGCKSKQIGSTSEFIEKTVFKKEVFDPFFRGLGTESFWTIEIGNDFIVYTAVDGVKEVFPFTQITRSKDTNLQTIISENKTLQISVRMVKGSCSDGMSDQVFDYQTEVTLTGKDINIRQKGCGTYLVSKQMQGKWELTSFRNEEIAENKFLKTPYIEFEGEGKRVYGNTSCNGFNGTFYLDDQSVRFSQLAVTRMMCVHENMEKEFLSEVPKITSYKINSNELQLYAGTELIMKLKKK